MPRPDFDNFSIHELMESINKRWFSKTALQIKTKDGWNKLSYVPLGERAVDISSSLLKLGMEKGDRAAVLSESRPEWGAALFGIISCGGIVVPMDVKLSEKEMAFILKDSGARFIFVSEKYLSVVDNIKAGLPELRHIFAIDDTDRQDLIKTKELKMRPGERKYLPLAMDDTAVIVYTSGTTGVAKGVEITYKNLIFQARELNRLVRYNESDNFLSMLPLNHMLELTGGFLSPLYVGATVTYCDSLKPSNIMAMMAETRTTAMITVPLVLKMFHDGIMKKAQSQPFISRKAFFTCLHLCRFLLRFRIKAGRLFFGQIHRQFGGRLRCFVSGGAPLDTTVEMDFNAMGFTILQGYGLTETSPVIAVNTFEELKYGSVGKPLPGVEVKLVKPDGSAGEEGEIATRGDHVMKGYFRNPEKTAEAIKSGWLHTGDIGKFDKDGFLYITGRIRNLIVLGGGKKVFPEEIEEVMSASPYIKEICVLGRKAQSGLKAGTEEVFAVIVPALEMFRDGARNDKEAVKKKIGEEITRLGGDLAEYKKISDYMLYFDELPKTSTRKVKRAEVMKMLAGTGNDPNATGAIEARFMEKINVSGDRSLPMSDIGIDSMGKIEIICALEKEYNCTISEEKWQKAVSLNDLIQLAMANKGLKGESVSKSDPAAEAKMIRIQSRIFLPSRLLVVLIFKVLFRMYIKVLVKGKENLPARGPFILVANHSSHLDQPLLLSLFPATGVKDVYFPAAADYFYRNICRRLFVIISLNAFPFEREGNFAKGLKVCKELINNGKSLILFPEGTRSPDGKIGDFRPGVGLLSIESGVPVVPVCIKGAHEALGKGHFFVKPGTIEIIIGSPVNPDGIENSYNGYKLLAGRLKNKVEELSRVSKTGK